MRKTLTLALAIVAAGAIFSPARARSPHRAPPADVLSADAILANVRQMGLAPNSRVVRRGPYYVLHAVDLRGVELRVVADAQFGDILSITPVLPANYTPYYVREPRIIHVPPPHKAKAR